MCRSLEHLPNTCLERAKELKARFGSFLLKQELNIMGHSQKTDKLMLEDRQNWSFHELLAHKEGQCAFTTFLSSEYSEENIAFYLACEDYRKTKSSLKLCSKARKIYEEFICSDAPREVNLDHETRTITLKNMEQPTLSCFNLARVKFTRSWRKTATLVSSSQRSTRNSSHSLRVKLSMGALKTAVEEMRP